MPFESRNRRARSIAIFVLSRLFALIAPPLLIAACSAPTSPLPAPASPPPLLPAPLASAPSSSFVQGPVCSAACTGAVSPELAAALRGAAQKAVHCYNRALRTAYVRGSMMVRVQVEASGDICRTAIESSGPEIAAFDPCVRVLFENRQFPPTTGGCVNVNIPLSFSIKEAKDGGS